MMNVTSETDLKELRTVTLAQKVKRKCFAVINPSLAEAIQSLNMTPSSIFVKIVEQIKVRAPVPPESQEDTDTTSTTTAATVTSHASNTTTTASKVATTETADQIMSRFGTVYAPIL